MPSWKSVHRIFVDGDLVIHWIDFKEWEGNYGILHASI